MKIINEITKDGKVEILFSTKISVSHEQPELFNGYKHNKDILPLLNINNKTDNRVCKPELKYNYPDQSLYSIVVIHLNKNLNEEELTSLGESIKNIFDTEQIIVKFGETEYNINLFNNDEIYIRQSNLEAPSGYIFLEDLFEEEKDKLAYHEFLNDKLSFDRLIKLCKKLKFKVTDEMITGLMLPIHRKDPATNSLLVYQDTFRHFRMYKLYQNYLKGFEEGSNEHQLGLAMAYDIKFNDYVLRCAEKLDKTGKNPNQENFTNEFNRAVKRIQK